MQIASSPASYVRPVPAGPLANQTQSAPQAAAEAEKPAGSPFSAARLASLLNMARPEKENLGDRLLAPGMTLALQVPASRPPSGLHVDVTPADGSGAVPIDLSPEGIARQMIEDLGSGDQITLADAQRALFAPSTTHTTNSRKTISNYFDRLDLDRSGGLDAQELTTLMRHYQAEQRRHDHESPRLPETWA